MDGPDREVLDALCAGSDAEPVWLVTLITTWGSSPRPLGSLLLIDEAGRVTGSVSGGCVEDDLALQVRSGGLSEGCPRTLDYGVADEQARRSGLPCGGRLAVLVERVDDRAQWRVLREAVAAGRTLARRLCLTTGEVSLHPADALADCEVSATAVTRVFGPRWRLLLIGAGDIARRLAPIAVALGYRVRVCDPREERFGAWDDSLAELDRRMPDDVVRDSFNDARAAVVALTHDPRLDDLALMAALPSRAFYVGALGSRSTHEARRARLCELGLAPEAIARLRGPVGLPIGGSSPAEIAVSIAAELIATRHQRNLRWQTA
jgi:xanthine dehydrogenase accessory factor